MATEPPAPPGRGAADTGSAPDLHCTLLGGFRVRLGARAVPDDDWRLLKARALVKLLALAPRHRLPREQLMDTLWPEAEATAARRNFNYALHVARHALDLAAGDNAQAHNLLSLKDGLLTLTAPGRVIVDVDLFNEALGRARRTRDPDDYQVALALYPGDLLPDDRYEEWASGPRETLREAFLLALLELARLELARGENASAIASLRQALQIAPAHEEAHTLLMSLYDRTGQRALALRQYAQLREALQQELAVEPDPETQRLYAAILAGQTRHPDRDEQPRKPAAETGAHPALPTPLDPFIGRERELAELLRLLHGETARARLATLTGTGGSGKTRLALEAARRLLPQYPARLWLVELAPLDDPARLPDLVARALGLREQPGVAPTALLIAALRRQPALLLIDNCEHLREAAAQLALALLSACPELRILATSREPLGLPGELVWRVPSLALPTAAEAAGTLAVIGASDAVSFFVRHAALRDPDFRLTAANTPTVVALCQRLDGLPLALELAAGRLPGLALGELTARLDNALTILTSDSGGRTTRQRTLRATLDWSHSLLSPAEAALFRRLAVFGGGWTLPAAEAVCADATLPAGAILTALVRLVDCSLVAVVPGKLETRYRLLETVRQYAQESLELHGEEEATRAAHAAYFLTVAERARPTPGGPDQAQRFDRLEAEQPNLRAAMIWALGQRQLAFAARLGAALEFFWASRGYHLDAHALLTRLLDLLAAEGSAPATAARTRSAQEIELSALRSAGRLAYIAAEYPVAQQLLTRLVALAQALDDEAALLGGLLFLGYVTNHRGQYATAEEALATGLALGRRRNQQYWIALCLNALGLTALNQGRYATAREHLQQGIPLLRQFDDLVNLSSALNTLGEVALCEGALAEASALQRESLALAHEVGAGRAILWATAALGHVAHAQGNDRHARDYFTAGLRLAHDQGAWWYIASCLDGLAEVAAAARQTERALRLHAATTALRQRLGIAPPANWQRAVIPTIATLKATHTTEVAAWSSGSTADLGEALDEAFSAHE